MFRARAGPITRLLPWRSGTAVPQIPKATVSRKVSGMFRFAATSALALGIAAPALADVTPAQVWENLQENYADFGYQVTGQVEDGGGTLTVRDAVFSMKNEGGATTFTIPRKSRIPRYCPFSFPGPRITCP